MLYLILVVLLIACAGICVIINMVYPLLAGLMLITKNQKSLAKTTIEVTNDARDTLLKELDAILATVNIIESLKKGKEG